MNNARMIMVVLAGLVLGGVSALAFLQLGRPFGGGTTVGKALVGGPFTLTDHAGKRVTDKDFRGRHMLILFGFTYCPDVCPSGLQVMSAALAQLGPLADRITPLFISIDPERDTPEQLGRYVQSFHPRLVGLTGTAAEIDAAAKAYRVYYKKVKDEKSAAEYTIDHSALIYLMDAKGDYVTRFTHSTQVEQMVERLRKAL